MKYFYPIIVLVSLFACHDEITPKEEVIVLGDVVISNQEELEQFAEEVQEIHYGNLEIRSPGPVDLSQLKKLRKIEGNLIVSETEHLTNLDGFANLESIEGPYLRISYNQSLENIDGLNSLSGYITHFDIHWNPKLKYINYLATSDEAYDISILGNKSLKSIEGFNSFEKVYSISIGNTTSLTEVTNVFNSLHTIKDGLAFGYNPELIQIQGFEKLSTLRDSDFLLNTSLSSIDIFQQESSIELNRLRIVGNNNLENLQAFENITKVSVLTIGENKNLENLNGLRNIDKVLNLEVINNIELFDFCGIRNIALGTDNFRQFYIANNGYNPTIDELVNLECNSD